MIIYDESGKVEASSATLDGQVPILPSGVFDYLNVHGEDRITWQPASTTRIAAVARHFAGKSAGFIVAGRNMRETEERESQLSLVVLAAWVGMIILTLIVSAYSFVVDRKEEESI